MRMIGLPELIVLFALLAIPATAIIVVVVVLLHRRNRTVLDAPSAAAFCARCGRPVPPGSAFCPACGTRR